MPEKHEPTDDARRLYERTKDELVAKQIENAKAYDQAVLSLSSAFLAFSVAFLSRVAAEQPPVAPCLLYLSWVAFGCAVVSTIVSFLYGQQAIKQLLAGAEAFYLRGDQRAREASATVSTRIDALNLTSGVIFILGVLFTILFAVANTEALMGGKEIRKDGQATNVFETPAAEPAADQGQSEQDAPAQSPAQQEDDG